MGRAEVVKSAIVLVEGRGQALHLGEDSSLNLAQGAHLAARFAAAGFRTSLRFILDAGQSVEEYSVLPHLPEAQIEGYRRAVAGAADRDRARREVVREIRERHLAVALRARNGNGSAAIDDGLFFSPLVAEVGEPNPGVLEALERCRHPAVDGDRLEDYRRLLEEFRGRSYLDLEEEVARRALARWLGERGVEVEVGTVSRPPDGATSWFREPPVARLVAEDLALKERGAGVESFDGRLIGVFPAVPGNGNGRLYFNSPTSTRYEHRKVRVLPRDRFGILQLEGSERLTFDHLRELIAAQARGGTARPLGIKYPYLAPMIAAAIAAEATAKLRDGPVTVAFVEGYDDARDPLDGCLAEALPEQVRRCRFSARLALYRELPGLPGGLPLIEDWLQANAAGLFAVPIDEARLLA